MKNKFVLAPWRHIFWLPIWLIFSLNSTWLHAQNTPPSFKLEKLADNLAIVWGMAWVSDHQLLLTQRSGDILLFDINTQQHRPITGAAKIKANGQGGLMDVATSSDKQGQIWYYFTYAKPLNGNQSATTLARAKLDIAHFRLIDWQDLLITNYATETGRHFGSRITFDQQGHVFFGVGDRGNRDNGQNPHSHAATILRLNLDGSIPQDNPFYTSKQGAAEVWSYGHRNPQGLSYDTKRSLLWEVEHGPRGGDEINLIIKGANYGWAKTSHGKEYWGPVTIGEGQEIAGIESPRKVYIPSIAPSSTFIYYGQEFPTWQDHLFIGALVGTHINIVEFDQNNQALSETRLLNDMKQRIRHLIDDQQGRIYFSTDQGQLYRMSARNK